VRAFYDEKIDDLKEPIQWHIREIVVKDKLKANELYVQLLKNVSFVETAKQNSIGKTAANGGDLGFITQEPFPEMANAILSIEKVGGISSVFNGPEGYYIVKLDEKKGGETIPFENIQEDISRNQLLLKQQQAIINYIEELKKKFKVVKNEGLLQ